ncbi:MAG: hypothetical protein PHP98_00080 [Kiritimatiellae bacterium]|nr:hypothetical protein [Kiritimatiellia bacterium]
MHLVFGIAAWGCGSSGIAAWGCGSYVYQIQLPLLAAFRKGHIAHPPGGHSEKEGIQDKIHASQPAPGIWGGESETGKILGVDKLVRCEEIFSRMGLEYDYIWEKDPLS